MTNFERIKWKNRFKAESAPQPAASARLPAPDDDLARIIATAPGGKGWAVGVPLEIDEGAIAAFPTHTVEI
jgi:hypothetical protein